MDQTQKTNTEISKLTAFVEAALSNPAHPVYQLGMAHSPILQHYAVNVSLLHSLTPAQWFEQYPHYRAIVETVLKLCEEGDGAEAATEADGKTPVKGAQATVASLRKQIADLTAKNAALEAKQPAAVAAAAEAMAEAGESEDETDAAADADDDGDGTDAYVES